MSIKRDDQVVVISGAYKQKTPAKVISVDRSRHKIEIENAGFVLRHVKRGHPKNPQGGRVQVPVAIAVSNVSLFCASCKRGVRTRKIVENGTASRRCVRCKAVV